MEKSGQGRFWGQVRERVWIFIILMMNRAFLFFPVFLLSLGSFGCFPKALVKPDTPPEERAYVQGGTSNIFYGVVIDAIDGNTFDISNSAYISPGDHSIRLSYYIGGAPNCTDHINFAAKPGGHYDIKVEVKDMWTLSPTRCYFWIEDVKTGEVVGSSSSRR